MSEDRVEKIASAIENTKITDELDFDGLISAWSWEFCGDVQRAQAEVKAALRRAIREALS